VDPLLIGAVVNEVGRCAGAVVLAAGVDGGCVEAAAVLGDGRLVERAGPAAPLFECPVEVEAGRRSAARAGRAAGRERSSARPWSRVPGRAARKSSRSERCRESRAGTPNRDGRLRVAAQPERRDRARRARSVRTPARASAPAGPGPSPVSSAARGSRPSMACRCRPPLSHPRPWVPKTRLRLQTVPVREVLTIVAPHGRSRRVE
jgi:hypothetical protein